MQYTQTNIVGLGPIRYIFHVVDIAWPIALRFISTKPKSVTKLDRYLPNM